MVLRRVAPRRVASRFAFTFRVSSLSVALRVARYALRVTRCAARRALHPASRVALHVPRSALRIASCFALRW
eukprot:9276980-Lingulodinium_polyedra.AAC.1